MISFVRKLILKRNGSIKPDVLHLGQNGANQAVFYFQLQCALSLRSMHL